MLGAYFDDSGTHGQSEIVVVAGILGTNSELATLNSLWREQIDRPLSGLKERVSEFHATDCFQSRGEFTGWKRHETDYFRHQLREVIVKSKVSGYGFACVRKEWDAEIQGKNRAFFGDPQRYAITSCFIRALRWARNFTFDPEISFIFDNNPERTRETRAIFDAFQLHERDKNISSISFLNSRKVAALQAADMFAWEFNRWAQDILEYGNRPPTTKEMQHLAQNMYYVDGQIARQEKIREMRDTSLEDTNIDIDFMINYLDNYGVPHRGSRIRSRRGKRQL